MLNLNPLEKVKKKEKEKGISFIMIDSIIHIKLFKAV